MSSINTKLELEIERELDAIDKMDVGSEEHTAAIRNLRELMAQVIDMQRLDNEELNKSEDRKAEQQHRLIGYIISALGIAVPAAVTIWGTKKSFKFEEFGTITSQAGREFFKRLFSKK